MSIHLAPDETLLTCRWITQGNRVVGDETCRRIDELISSYLVMLARGDGGWSRLFRDPTDGRLWEHTYPHGGMHGGGPPELRCLSTEQAVAKYGPL